VPPIDAPYDFCGTVALVTGAASGIGLETARAFAARGADVIATDIDCGSLEKLSMEANSSTWRLRILGGDLTDAGFIGRLIGFAGNVDVLVNCAGWVKHAPFLESEPADWEKVYAVNVLALLRLTQIVARGMCVRHRGHIINISSILARRVYPYTFAYAGTKHAVRAISEGLRTELQHDGVKVTEVAPGLTETNIFRDIDHPAVIQTYAKFDFLKLKPAEIARTIVFAVAAPLESCPEVIAVNPMGQA
jgi:NADP-dependent 3-hydroxy acid dehydrogenase YdfG